MKQISLTQGKAALVDDADYEFLMQWKWHYRNGYAMRNSLYRKFRMHRDIAERIGLDLSKQIDHINRDKLDNRRENLRPSDSSQNKANQGLICSNSTGFKGVSRTGNRYRASIRVKDKQFRLGWFSTAEEAAAAYDQAAKRYFGEYACLNRVRCGFTDGRGTWSSNTSGFRGVGYKRTSKRWFAVICVKRRRMHLGYFDSKNSAALAYNAAALLNFGPGAYQNNVEIEP